MRQLLAPRLVVLHVLVLVVVLVLGRLGLWQLDRLDEAQARNDAAAARLEEAPVPVGELLAGLSTDDVDELAELEYRAVTATGSWVVTDEVLHRGRSHAGQAGLGVLTPLALEDGGVVLVRRGTVPFDNDLLPPVADAAPPTGTVTVTGLLERSIPQPTGPVAQVDAPDGELDLVFNADLDRLAPQLPDGLLPMLVTLQEQSPPQPGTLPLLADPPALDDGPHLSYAVQWFSFALIAVGMYALWLRRRVRGDERAVSRVA